MSSLIPSTPRSGQGNPAVVGRQLLTESPDLISEVGHSKIWRLEWGRGGARQLRLFPQWLEVGELSSENENDFPDFLA